MLTARQSEKKGSLVSDRLRARGGNPGAKRGAIVEGCYELLEVLRQGGMAEVWLARDLQSNSLLAIKFLRPDRFLALVDDDDRPLELKALRERFRREATLLKSLRHRGIVELYRHGNHGADPYIAMQYIDGTPLDRFVSRYSLTLGVSAAVIAQIAEALGAIDAAPVVHRDIKPENIMIDSRGVVILIDFGIALPLSPGATRYTVQGRTLGSAGYQAPEQLESGRMVTPKTDVYALGCVYYLLLTGGTVFPLDSPTLREQHLFQDLQPPSARALREIPAQIDDLVMAMLDKDPANRPSAGEVRSTVTPILPKQGDPPPTPRYDPDPTTVFRDEDAVVEPDPPIERERIAVRRSPRGGTWLVKREVRGNCDAAQAELEADEPGAAMAATQQDLPAAQKQWGLEDELVGRMCMTVAEHLRIFGDCGVADGRYQEYLSVRVLDTADPDPDYLKALLGSAECKIKWDEAEPALSAIRTLLAAVGKLSAAHRTALVRRALDIADWLIELNIEEAVALRSRLEKQLRSP